MKKQRKHYTPEEKVAFLRRHLLEKESISKLPKDMLAGAATGKSTRSVTGSWRRPDSNGRFVASNLLDASGSISVQELVQYAIPFHGDSKRG